MTKTTASCKHGVSVGALLSARMHNIPPPVMQPSSLGFMWGRWSEVTPPPNFSVPPAPPRLLVIEWLLVIERENRSQFLAHMQRGTDGYVCV